MKSLQDLLTPAKHAREVSNRNNITPEKLTHELNACIGMASAAGDYKAVYLFHSKVPDTTIRVLWGNLVGQGYNVELVTGLDAVPDNRFNISWEVEE